jgi:hypothetical protein
MVSNRVTIAAIANGQACASTQPSTEIMSPRIQSKNGKAHKPQWHGGKLLHVDLCMRFCVAYCQRVNKARGSARPQDACGKKSKSALTPSFL